MPRYNEILNAFLKGEVTPKLYGRSDTELYRQSCRTLKNMIVHPQGGASRRMGTEFVRDKFYLPTNGNNRALNANARLVSFNISDEESYIVIFHADTTAYGDNYFFTVYNTNDNTAVPVLFAGGTSFGFPYASIGAGTGSSNVDANAMEDADLLASLQYAQNGNILFFAHPSIPPFYIQRTGKNSIIASDFYRPLFDVLTAPATPTNARIWQCWPYMDINVTAITITPSGTTGSITLTASAALFTSNMIGTPVLVTNSGTNGVAFITAFTSSTEVTATVVSTMPGTSAYTAWALSAWSKEYGWPRSVSFFQGRTVWGGTTKFPEKIWFSQSYDIYELTNANILPGGTIRSSDPGSVQVLASEVNEIQWLASGNRNLIVGTRGREFSLEILTGDASQVGYRMQTSFGSEAIQPAVAEDTPVFVQRGFRKLREMVYDYRIEGYSSPELTVLAEHFPRVSQEILGDGNPARFKYLAYQALDNSILWALDNNGYLYGCSKSRESSIVAFHRHELGGDYGGNYPKVLSIASVRNKNRTSDNLYMLVQRTVNGNSVIYLERLVRDFYGTTLHNDLDVIENQPVFVDCAKIFRPSDANFWVPFRANSTAIVAGGTAIGTTTGSVSYANGVFQSTAANSYVEYNADLNADFQQVGCIRFRARWASLAATATLFAISQSSGSQNNMISINIENDRDVVLFIYDSTGTPIISENMGNLATEYGVYNVNNDFVFELNYDITNGATRLFVNGKQLGSTQTETGTRSSSIDWLGINADVFLGNSRADIFISDFMVFDSVQHIADHDVFQHQQADNSIINLDYLEGEEVAVVADGLYLGDEEITSGAITLADEYSTIIVGLKYTHLLETMAIDAGTGIGSAQGSIKRIDRAVVRFVESAAASIGPDVNTVEEQVFRVASTPVTDPIELVTDDKVIEFPGDYDRQARIVVTGSDPLPCNVTCIVVRGITYDV